MSFFDEVMKPLMSLFLGVLLILWLITWCSYKFDVEVSEANIIDIYQEGSKIYQGKQAFITVESGGMTTHLTIYKNLYPRIVDRIYSSPDIKITPHKGE